MLIKTMHAVGQCSDFLRGHHYHRLEVSQAPRRILHSAGAHVLCGHRRGFDDLSLHNDGPSIGTSSELMHIRHQRVHQRRLHVPRCDIVRDGFPPVPPVDLVLSQVGGRHERQARGRRLAPGDFNNAATMQT